MMYISVSRFEKALSPSLRAILSSDDGVTQNDNVIREVIKQASSLIDSYAGYRYVIPLTYVSNQIKAICIDIAIYRLFKRKDAVNDELFENYKSAIDYLKDVSKDRALIEGAELKGNYENSGEKNVYAKSTSDEPKFDESNLEGWKII